MNIHQSLLLADLNKQVLYVAVDLASNPNYSKEDSIAELAKIAEYISENERGIEYDTNNCIAGESSAVTNDKRCGEGLGDFERECLRASP
ncbi:hypothetical protein DNHGIG_14730 [Collibacillus ludicampi]|uniref:Uncharacterized protein n=1 Tax=Collibacillus ludicampi TaxID=2771369 RepID=A0AAV4LDZ2_9BACL|nr:hypothetical protein [Collibacillus ludicampi]GIM45924.1 hypothetical protein DNHGIG_14730 [Collibacillus ludicampi]